MVGTEIELKRNCNLLRIHIKIRTQFRRAGHKIALRIIYIIKVQLEVGRRKIILGTHYRREELLLKSKPADTCIKPFLTVASTADFIDLIVIRETVVHLGILHLVLVAFLKTRYYDIPVNVEH